MNPRIGGRCHAMCNFGGRLVCFGGGADISNTVAWLDCKPRDPQPPTVDPHELDDASRACGLELTWGQPKEVEGVKPRPRLSHAAVRAGRHMLVFGGWSQGELNDVQVRAPADLVGLVHLPQPAIPHANERHVSCSCSTWHTGRMAPTPSASGAAPSMPPLARSWSARRAQQMVRCI